MAEDKPKHSSARARFVVVGVLLVLTPSVSAKAPPVTALAFSPDGRYLAAGSAAGLVIYRWPKLDDGQRIQDPLPTVHDIAWAPDGSALAVAGGVPGEAGTVCVHEWPSRGLRWSRTDHEDVVYSVAWSPHGDRLVSAGQDHLVVVHEALGGEPQTRLSGHSRGVLAACILADGSTLVTAGADQTLRVWELASGNVARTLSQHTGAVYGLAQRPAASRGGLPWVASVADDRTVRFWQPTSGRMVRFARLDKVLPLAIAWSNDGARLYVAADDGQVRWIDPETAVVTEPVPVIDGWIYSLTVNPRDGAVVVGGEDATVRRVVWPKP